MSANRAANNCRVNAPTIESDRPWRATNRCGKLTVLTSSSGRSGDPPKAPAGMSAASYFGKFCAMASARSMLRNVGAPPSLDVAEMASAVILLLIGPAAMKTSAFWLRTASATSLVANWTIWTLAGSTAYCDRITLRRLTLAGVRPITPILLPASCDIFVIGSGPFGAAGSEATADFALVVLAFLAGLALMTGSSSSSSALAGLPALLTAAGAPFAPAGVGTQRTATFLRSEATASAFFGMSRSARTIATSALPSPIAAALETAPSVITGRKRTRNWSRLKLCVSA